MPSPPVPDYEFHSRSNVGCVREREAEWLAIMEATFRASVPALFGNSSTALAPAPDPGALTLP